MWFGSYFTVGVARRLLLPSRVSLLVINLLTIRERKETRDEINLRTDSFSRRIQVLRGFFFSRNSFQQQFKG